MIGGALIVALATWMIRRRHGGGVIEPAREAVWRRRTRPLTEQELRRALAGCAAQVAPRTTVFR